MHIRTPNYWWFKSHSRILWIDSDRPTEPFVVDKTHKFSSIFFDSNKFVLVWQLCVHQNVCISATIPKSLQFSFLLLLLLYCVLFSLFFLLLRMYIVFTIWLTKILQNAILSLVKHWTKNCLRFVWKSTAQ